MTKVGDLPRGRTLRGAQEHHNNAFNKETATKVLMMPAPTAVG
jgi:hypothetical protein